MNKKTIKKVSIILLIIILGTSAYTYSKIVANNKGRELECFNSLLIKLENGIQPDSIFQEDYDKLQLLVEYSLAARTEMLEVVSQLNMDKDAPISSRDLLILKQGSESYLEIREDLLTLANAYECAVDVEDATLDNFNINKKLRLKGLMLSLGAALTLYDNYFIGIVLFEQDSRLRRLVNDPDMGFGLMENKLDEVTLNANSIETRHRVRRAITFYEEAQEALDDFDEDSDYSYLKLLIESSPSYNYVKKIRVKEVASKKFVAFERITSEMISESSRSFSCLNFRITCAMATTSFSQ